MHKAQAQVRDFHRGMGLPAPMEGQEYLPKARMELRVSLIQEELEELKGAAGYDDEKKAYRINEEFVDALGDLLYVVYGTAVEAGLDMEPFFELIHEANMKKGPGPMREDGKKLKPPGWTPPNHTQELKRQIGIFDPAGSVSIEPFARKAPRG